MMSCPHCNAQLEYVDVFSKKESQSQLRLLGENYLAEVELSTGKDATYLCPSCGEWLANSRNEMNHLFLSQKSNSMMCPKCFGESNVVHREFELEGVHGTPNNMHEKYLTATCTRCGMKVLGVGTDEI